MYELLKNRTKIYIALGVVFLVILTLFIWHTFFKNEVIAEDVPLVRTIVVGAESGNAKFNYSGEVRGRYESQLAFQVGGKIINRYVNLGSEVNPGDVLMQIDAKDIQQVVNVNSAQVYSAQSQLNLAAANLERYGKLYEQGAISKMQYDQYVNASQVAEGSALVASAQYAQGRNQLDYSLLKADKPGVITALSAEVGQVVSAGQIVAVLVQKGDREIEISIPESQIESLRNAKQIEISFWALPSLKLAGSVREISPMADSVTRTYKARISILNLSQEIKLGMTANVTISDAKSINETRIPLSAVYQTDQGTCVWVIADGKATLRSVQIANFGDSATVVVTGGLHEGESIATAGVHKLHEGQKVRTGGALQ
jgi:membrane fusion protein, multidrug efflux system